MATVIKDLGAVTAYAYAVEGGYTGTEEEFAALLGNIADDLSQIENLSVTVTTLPAGSSATASYSNGVLALGIPKGDKGDKGDTGATPAFTIGTVTTLAAGNDASASITGTAAAPVLNLGIPKGADGDVSSASMATAYSTSATYAVGDYVWYSGQLYCCTTAISTAESWTAAHWTAVKLAEDVGNLKSAFDVDHTVIEDIKTDGGLGSYDPLSLTIETGTQYLITNGVASKNTSSSSWCSAVVPVSPGESYLVTVRSQITGKYGCIFTDDSFNVIAADIEGLDDSATVTVRSDQLEYVPMGATKMILNSCESSGTIISAKKYAFAGIPISVIAENTMAYIKQSYTILNGYYVKTGNTFSSNTSYFSVYAPCVPGDRFKVSTNIKDSVVSIIQYYKADGSLLSYVDNSGSLPQTVTDYAAVAPNLAAYFSVTSYQTSPVIYKYTIDAEPPGYQIYLHRRNALAEVMFKYTSEKDAIVTFNKVGPNNILQIAGFQTVDNTNRYCSGNFDASRTTLRNAGSDWMSPYKVVAVNNADGDGSGQGVDGYYTGGFHGYNGDQTGSATGETTSYKFFVDGKEVTETSDAVYHAAKEVVILVTNAIQGNNTTKSDGTGRAILQEQIKYTVTPNRIDIVNTITALEDIVVSQYYGLQLYAFSNMTGFEYFGDTHKIYDFSANTTYTDEIDYLVGGVAADPDRMVCQLDKKGIGRHQYIKSGGIMARSIPRKAYNSLIDNSPTYLPLSTNDSVFISGHYAFAEGYIPN